MTESNFPRLSPWPCPVSGMVSCILSQSWSAHHLATRVSADIIYRTIAQTEVSPGLRLTEAMLPILWLLVLLRCAVIVHSVYGRYQHIVDL